MKGLDDAIFDAQRLHEGVHPLLSDFVLSQVHRFQRWGIVRVIRQSTGNVRGTLVIYSVVSEV
jgi:hypothetical protein